MSWEYVIDPETGAWTFERLETKTEKAVVDPKPVKPWKTWIWYPYEGFDTKRWPNTFKTLLMIYHMPDWTSGGKVIPGSYRNFLDFNTEEDTK